MSKRNARKQQPAGRIARNVKRHPPAQAVKLFQAAMHDEATRASLLQKAVARLERQ